MYGQGIVPETLVMTDSPNFSIGGGIHIVINNQLGFTTETPHGTKNVTDIGKIVNCPIIHVNAASVIDVAKAAMLAADYRQVFRKDIFINLIGYRRWGHNELDDPTITQPLMYAAIASRQSISEQFTDFLTNTNCLTSPDELSNDLADWVRLLNEQLDSAPTHEPELLTFKAQWANQNILDTDTKSLGIYDTGVSMDVLKDVGQRSVYVPAGFSVHDNVLRTHIQRRLDRLSGDESAGGNIDWATAEALAFGSLLADGVNCRLSGQDVGRGTFSHRHFVLVDQATNARCVPFNASPSSGTGYLEVANSGLSEEAVLGFEIGMAMDSPAGLVVWEAQFGDFFNGAQILVDTYLGSAETKWLLQNGLVLLLPHGYDGAGPEHSSCRLERFLQLTDSAEARCDSDAVNMHVVNPTTPAQYFHALRRQVVRPFRRPLIVAAPKLLLRSTAAMSKLSELANGTFFRHVLPDAVSGDGCEAVETVLLCSGKHYYTLRQHMDGAMSAEDRRRFAIIRIEQLAPFPSSELKEEIGRFKNARSFKWCQEEARNMGAWQFVGARVRNMLGIDLAYAGRKELATPAVGIGSLHKGEIGRILETTFRL